MSLRHCLESYIALPSHKGKTRVVQTLMDTFPMEVLRSYYGPEMVVVPNDKTCLYAISGIYGSLISDFISTLPPNGVFIDIGANYGLFSLLAARRMPRGHVFSFEPNPNTFSIFLENIKLNDAKNLTPFKLAIGQEDKSLWLSHDPRHSGRSRVQKETSDIRIEKIGAEKMSDLLAGKIPGDATVTVKIDVEGYEMTVLQCLAKTLFFPLVRHLIVEIDEDYLLSYGTSGKDIYDLLESLGFTPRTGRGHSEHYDEIFSRG